MSVSVLPGDDFELGGRGLGSEWTPPGHVVLLAAHHNDDGCHQSEHGNGRGESNYPNDRHAVPARHRVIMKTIKQERVDCRADVAVRRLDDGVPQISGPYSMPKSYRASRPSVVSTMTPDGCANCFVSLSHMYRKPAARVSRSMDGWSPVKKCQAAAAPGCLYLPI